MEKKIENADVQKVQSANDDVQSPNTKRRLKMRPNLHIKIPFFKRGHKNLSPSVCHEGEAFPSVCQSLPSESHMPSNIRDVVLCDPTDNNVDFNETDDTDGVPIREKESEDDLDSEKHQSDREENEKDSSDSEIFLTCPAPGDDGSAGDAETPTPGMGKCHLKSCLKGGYQGRPRASTYPGPVDCLEASFQRCVKVTFSPDTVEPKARNCKYREWIERNSQKPKSAPVNIKHEKRKCQLNQMRKVNLSDYMSKSYGSSFFSPGGSYGGDMLL